MPVVSPSHEQTADPIPIIVKDVGCGFIIKSHIDKGSFPRFVRKLLLPPNGTKTYNDCMARAKKNSDRHKQKTVSFRLPEALMAQFRLLAEQNRRTLSGEAQLALEKHLTDHGLSLTPDGDAVTPPPRTK